MSDHELLARLAPSAARARNQMAAGPPPGDEPGREASRPELRRGDRTPDWLRVRRRRFGTHELAEKRDQRFALRAQIVEYRGAACRHRRSVAHAGRERKRLRRVDDRETPGVQVREQRHFEQNFGVVTIA